jgi:hypothetical protein
MENGSILRSAAVLFCFLVSATVTSAAMGAPSDDEGSAPESAGDDTAAAVSDESEDVATNVPEKKTVTPSDKSYGHQGQFHVRLALGYSYRIVMRYDNSPQCSTTPNEQGNPRTLCGFGAPILLEPAVGFAPLAGVEPFLWGRFGLAKESVSGTSPLVILGAGVRLYTMSDAAFKFFVEPAVGVELEKGTDRRYQYKQDFIVRLTIGPQYDFSKNFGAYVAAGLTVGMLRSLQSWMDLQAGLQARFP